MEDDLSKVRKMMEWCLTLSVMTKKSLKKQKEKEITCFRCKKVGHYESECEEELPQKISKERVKHAYT